MMLTPSIPNDIFHRFTPTPFSAELTVMGRRLHLDTNSPVLLKHTRRVFARYHATNADAPTFTWRIISDPTSGLRPPLSRRIAFSDEGIRFINFNQRAFLAVDLAARQGIGVLSSELCEDEMGLYSPFLSDLFDLTSAALGLTEIMAGCVALKGCGLLVFGPPRSGKTTTGYLSGKMGMEFLADQVTCLELVSSRLRAWGQFWPPAFRPETLQFLPEIQNLTRPFRYRDFTLLCLESSGVQPVREHGVVPKACVFLERCAADTPQLTRLTKEELTPLLADSLPFIEDPRFDAQRGEVVRCLAELPAYHLAYSADPQMAAALFQTLLTE
jgi:hypothetical protein